MATVSQGIEAVDGGVAYAPTKRKLNVHEYHRMGEAGILGFDERVELLDGELYTLPPQTARHSGTTIALGYLFRPALDQALQSIHNPIRLSEYSEPQPDVALLRPRPDFYGTSKARPEDVFLLVEVAESSLQYDRRTKLPLYAAAGIPEVWIVNLIARQIEVYPDSAGYHYATATVHTAGETLTPVALPDVVIRVGEILG